MNALISASSYRPDFSTPGYQNAKSLEVIGDKTLLEHQVDSLLKNGIDQIFVVLPKGSEEATRFLQNKRGVHSIFLSKPLGTGGAIALAPLDEDLLFVPGNLFFEVDLPSMLRFHQEREALLTCLSRPEPHPEKKDVLTLKDNGRGFIILPKETTGARDFFYSNLIPTDFAILSPDLLCTFDPDDPWPLDFHKETFEPTLAVEGLYSYFSPEYAFEITNAETLAKVPRDLKAGIPAQKCLKNPRKAFFLDRDGTI
ncbi:MAG: NDP-sugar synthase, partial [Candidatus Enteromonas sp.]